MNSFTSSSRLRWGAKLAVVAVGVLTPACSLLNPAPSLPSYDEVVEAREHDADEWKRIEQLLATWEQQGELALPSLKLVAHGDGISLRIRALIQDIELDYYGPVQVAADYHAIWRDSHLADDAYLAARVANAGAALGLAAAAIQLEPQHLEARVLLLGLGATAEDASPLDKLVEIIDDNPGCAEAWRLLAELSPFYARPDLAAAAAEVEPWLPVVDPEILLLLRAETKLANGENERALALLQSCKRRPGRMLRAKAMVANNELQPAQHLLEQLIAEQPEDPIARFNLGLLAYEYLHDFSLARNEFSRVLELAEGGASIPLLQSTQCRLWLERMDAE